jgi:hypothetical protein
VVGHSGVDETEGMMMMLDRMVYWLLGCVVVFIFGSGAAILIMFWSDGKPPKKKTPKVHNRWPGL